MTLGDSCPWGPLGLATFLCCVGDCFRLIPASVGYKRGSGLNFYLGQRGAIFGAMICGLTYVLFNFGAGRGSRATSAFGTLYILGLARGVIEFFFGFAWGLVVGAIGGTCYTYANCKISTGNETIYAYNWSVFCLFQGRYNAWKRAISRSLYN